ncbi:hypothetical protein IQ249_04555 [Lusitaniella coriacea LEGE 07157]|uniref:Uncharacterized protein n=1 Tax=Lusitaniella coriacea LEGE 07157 TaxID=945747 RepID=A0A8J7B878_9CYAN|nr:hypothetical protein [Lusitaniella coriacea LEGE 07157]
MEPLSAYAIATLAFISGNAASTVVGKLTETALEKANELRKKIWDKLRGKEEAEKALKAVEEGAEAELETVADYLKIAMREDPNFAAEIQALAKEIEGKIDDNSPIMMIIRDNAQGILTNDTNYGGTHHKANTINNIYGTPPKD